MNPVANLPPQPVMIPGDPSYATRFNEWVKLANQAMESYKSEYTASMSQQGVKVTWDTPVMASPGSPFQVPPTYNATLTKDGFSTTSTVSIGRAQTSDPSTLASFDQMFNLKFQAQVNSPQGQLPSDWYNPVSQPAPWVYNPEPFSTPGPRTTVEVPVQTIQPTQTPPTPDAGTIVTPPPAASQNDPIRYNFWEWNWFYEQESGRTGPPPEAVGVADPRALMTKAQWWEKVSAWYAAPPTGTVPTGSNTGQPGAPGGPGGGGGNGGGNWSGPEPAPDNAIGSPHPKDYTQAYLLGAALLAVMLLARR